MSADERTLTVDAGDRSRDSRATTRDGRGAQPGLLCIFSESGLPDDGAFALPPDRAAGIGRQADQHVYIEDRGLSREHATLGRGGGRYVLRDLGSHNGTFVDGVRVEGQREINVGALIRCGTTLLLLVDDVRDYAGWPQRALQAPLCGGAAIARVRRSIDMLAKQPVDVLIRGESGCGKEVVAGMLHASSQRRGELVAVNCAALPESLFEAELFGAERGAYTGASEARRGLFEQAADGTLFLDEIGELPVSLQPKLLRVVESGEVRRVGGDERRVVDVRIVAATNRDLAQEVDAGRFRADLYYRLRGSEIVLPPLRERREDIALLAPLLLSRADGAIADKRVAAPAIEALCLHHWPGNVRELSHAIFEAASSAALDGSARIEVSHLRADVVARDAVEGDAADDEETARVARALHAAAGHVGKAAADLGISRSRLYRMLAARGMRPKDFR